MKESNCKTMKGVSNFPEWLEKVRPEHRELAEQLYALIKNAFGQFEESIKWGNPCFSYGGAKRCYLADQSACVHLGFYNGASLTNTDGLVEGTGKAMRHVKVLALDAGLASKLKKLIVESAKLPKHLSAV